MKIKYNGKIQRHSRASYSGCSACGGGLTNSETILREFNVRECRQDFRFLLGHTYMVPDEIANVLLTSEDYIDTVAGGIKHHVFGRVD